MEQNVGLALLATSIEESTNHHSARDLQKPTLKSEFRGHERQVPVPFSGLQAPAPTVRVHVDRSPSHFSARSGGAHACGPAAGGGGKLKREAPLRAHGDAGARVSRSKNM